MPSGVIMPTIPVNVISWPPDARVRFCAPANVPSRVLAKEMAPPVVALELRVVVPVKVTGPANDIAVLFVTTLAPIDTDPAPVCWKAPEVLKLDPGDTVRAPEFARTKGPVLAVVKEPVRFITTPVRWTPPLPVEVMPEAAVVVPVELRTVKAPTFMVLLISISLTLGLATDPAVIEVSGAMLPTGPLKIRRWPQVSKVTLRLFPATSASKVELKMISAPPAQVEKVILSAVTWTGAL